MAASRKTAERIRAGLKAAGISQAALARYCGVSRQLVTFWLSKDDAKRLAPSDEHLELIAKRLNTTSERLRGVSLVNEPGGRHDAIPDKHAHGADSRWRREAREAVESVEPKLAQSFDAVVQTDHRRWQFDFLTPRLAVALLGTRTDPAYIREQLWMLACLQKLDAQMHAKRVYVAFAAANGNTLDGLAAEAALHGIELKPVQAKTAGRWLSEHA